MAAAAGSPATRPNTGAAPWRHAAAALEASLALPPNIAAAIHAPTSKDGPVRATLRLALSKCTGSSALRDSLWRALGHLRGAWPPVLRDNLRRPLGPPRGTRPSVLRDGLRSALDRPR